MDRSGNFWSRVSRLHRYLLDVPAVGHCDNAARAGFRRRHDVHCPDILQTVCTAIDGLAAATHETERGNHTPAPRTLSPAVLGNVPGLPGTGTRGNDPECRDLYRLPVHAYRLVQNPPGRTDCFNYCRITRFFPVV